MLERMIYRNHMNEEIAFGDGGGIFVNYSDLHDFAWNHKSKGDRISAFNTGIVKKTIPVVIQCFSEEEGIELKNKLFECAEKDVLAMQYGRIIIGDYYMRCYVSGSKKTDYLTAKNHLKASLTIVTDMPRWIKETTATFRNVNDASSEGKNLDFNNDFPYDYASNLLGRSLVNTNFIESNFRIVVYGACTNPEIVIAGHSYKVNVTLAQNEYLTIDSTEKTIVLTHEDGSKENCFNNRDRDSYIFEKIPVGSNGVSSGSFDFDVTLLEERSEPKWI